MGMSQKNILGTWMAGRLANREKEEVPVVQSMPEKSKDEYDTIRKTSKNGSSIVLRRKKCSKKMPD